MRNDLEGLSGKLVPGNGKKKPTGSGLVIPMNDAAFKKLFAEEFHRLNRATDNLASMIQTMGGAQQKTAVHSLTKHVFDRISYLEEIAHPEKLERTMCIAHRFLFRELEKFRVAIEQAMKE